MPKAHRHRWREATWTLEGPLKVYIECQTCVRGHAFPLQVEREKDGRIELVVRQLRKAPEGMTQERFEAYMELVRGGPELVQALRDRLRSATDRQRGDAWQKGILVPLPTPETLDAYRARTAERMEKRAA